MRTRPRSSSPPPRAGDRLHSFCDASLRAPNPTMMVVPDTLEDARFCNSQFVKGEPHVRFYSGAPLVRISAAGCTGRAACCGGSDTGRVPPLLQGPCGWRCESWPLAGGSAAERAERAVPLPPPPPQVSSEGHVLGSLGVMDIKPRSFPAGAHGAVRRRQAA